MPTISQDKSKDIVLGIEKLIRLLQDLFILEGIKADVDKEQLRRLLAIDKTRINNVSKLFKKDNE